MRSWRPSVSFTPLCTFNFRRSITEILHSHTQCTQTSKIVFASERKRFGFGALILKAFSMHFLSHPVSLRLPCRRPLTLSVARCPSRAAHCSKQQIASGSEGWIHALTRTLCVPPQIERYKNIFKYSNDNIYSSLLYIEKTIICIVLRGRTV